MRDWMWLSWHSQLAPKCSLAYQLGLALNTNCILAYQLGLALNTNCILAYQLGLALNTNCISVHKTRNMVHNNMWCLSWEQIKMETMNYFEVVACHFYKVDHIRDPIINTDGNAQCSILLYTGLLNTWEKKTFSAKRQLQEFWKYLSTTSIHGSVVTRSMSAIWVILIMRFPAFQVSLQNEGCFQKKHSLATETWWSWSSTVSRSHGYNCSFCPAWGGWRWKSLRFFSSSLK